MNREAKRRGYRAAGLVLGLFLLAAPACRDRVEPGKAEVSRPSVSGLTVRPAAAERVPDILEVSGTVEPKARSVIASRMMGTVLTVNVSEGDRVKAGAVLIIIDDRDVAHRVEAAEKAVAAAEQSLSLNRITHERYRKLRDEKAASGQEFDQIATQHRVAELEYERAKAMHAEAQVHSGYTRITAPVSGVITEKKIEPGSMAVPGAPLLTLEDSSSFRVEAAVDEKYAGLIGRGTVARLRLESHEREFAATVTEVVPAVDPLSRRFLVKIGVKAEGVRSGQYVKVGFLIGTKEAVLVPKEAVVVRGQLSGVFIVDDAGILTYRLIRTGRDFGDRIEVLSGLHPEERVVVSNVERAVDGARAAETK